MIRCWAGWPRPTLQYRHSPRYTCKNLSLGMPACVRMVRRVDPFMLRWLGVVRGVRVASGFSLTIWKCGCLHVQDGSPDSTEP
jgi:hypothetical protein